MESTSYSLHIYIRHCIYIYSFCLLYIFPCRWFSIVVVLSHTLPPFAFMFLCLLFPFDVLALGRKKWTCLCVCIHLDQKIREAIYIYIQEKQGVVPVIFFFCLHDLDRLWTERENGSGKDRMSRGIHGEVQQSTGRREKNIYIYIRWLRLLVSRLLLVPIGEGHPSAWQQTTHTAQCTMSSFFTKRRHATHLPFIHIRKLRIYIYIFHVSSFRLVSCYFPFSGQQTAWGWGVGRSWERSGVDRCAPSESISNRLSRGKYKNINRKMEGKADKNLIGWCRCSLIVDKSQQ